MRHEVLVSLTEEELDAYAKTCGITFKGAPGLKAKIEAIEGRRSRVATISIFGFDIEIPVKKLHDKRLSDTLKKGKLTDAQAEKVMRDLLGVSQHKALIERITDEDGTVDVEAYGMALARILTDENLKNF